MLDENIKSFITQDGSIGLYNKKLDEIYHSKYGAKKEAYEKFIEPILKINFNKPIKVLDICYGIGYNTKCLLENIKNINSIDCIEIDENLARKSFEFKYNETINKVIKDNLEKPNFIFFHFEDIRNFIQKTNKRYDVIFHDGFAPYKQPELWSEDLIIKISNHLKKDGIYITYNHSKPVLNALLKAKLIIGKTIKNNKTIGTIASFDDSLIQNPLDDFEIGSLDTKSAITYKDNSLNLTSEEIIQNRLTEQNNSKLKSLSSYLKNHKN